MNQNLHRIGERGSALLEVVVCTSILVLVMLATASSIVLFLRAQQTHTQRIQAAYLLEEAAEAVRFLRTAGWATAIAPLQLGAPYHLAFLGSGYEATTTPQLHDGRFTRTMTFSPVYRKNIDDDIAPAGYAGATTLDAGTLRVDFSVTWGIRHAVAAAFAEGATDGDLANFPSEGLGGGDPAQSFTLAGDSAEISSVELLLKRASGSMPSDVFLEIRSGSTVGAVVASSPIMSSSAVSDTSYEWTTFTLTEQPTLSGGETYYIRLRSDPDSTEVFSGSTGTLRWAHEESAGSPYADGEAYRSVGHFEDPSYPGETLTDYDFSFRVIKETVANRLDAQTYITNYLGS